MNAYTLARYERHLQSAAHPARSMPPRPVGQRPKAPAPLSALEAHRNTINRSALAQPGPANDDLASARGYCAAHPRLLVVDQIVDTLDQVDARADEPHLRRGYARARRMMADPASPVRGVVAVSRTAITLADRLYEDQLSWYACHQAGLWLVRGEAAI